LYQRLALKRKSEALSEKNNLKQKGAGGVGLSSNLSTNTTKKKKKRAGLQNSVFNKSPNL
jgi:hypothetical protein